MPPLYGAFEYLTKMAETIFTGAPPQVFWGMISGKSFDEAANDYADDQNPEPLEDELFGSGFGPEGTEEDETDDPFLEDETDSPFLLDTISMALVGQPYVETAEEIGNFILRFPELVGDLVGDFFTPAGQTLYQEAAGAEGLLAEVQDVAGYVGDIFAAAAEAEAVAMQEQAEASAFGGEIGLAFVQDILGSFTTDPKMGGLTGWIPWTPGPFVEGYFDYPRTEELLAGYPEVERAEEILGSLMPLTEGKTPQEIIDAVSEGVAAAAFTWSDVSILLENPAWVVPQEVRDQLREKVDEEIRASEAIFFGDGADYPLVEEPTPGIVSTATQDGAEEENRQARINGLMEQGATREGAEYIVDNGLDAPHGRTTAVDATLMNYLMQGMSLTEARQRVEESGVEGIDISGQQMGYDPRVAPGMGLVQTALAADGLEVETPSYADQFRSLFNTIPGSQRYEAQQALLQMSTEAESLFYLLRDDWTRFGFSDLGGDLVGGQKQTDYEKGLYTQFLNTKYFKDPKALRFGPDFYKSVRDLRDRMGGIAEYSMADLYATLMKEDMTPADREALEFVGEKEPSLTSPVATKTIMDRFVFMGPSGPSTTRLATLVGMYNIHPGADNWLKGQMMNFYQGMMKNWMASGRDSYDFIRAFVKEKPAMAKGPSVSAEEGLDEQGPDEQNLEKYFSGE